MKELFDDRFFFSWLLISSIPLSIGKKILFEKNLEMEYKNGITLETFL